MTYLLDVNVLIALLDQAHINHSSAHRWFAKLGKNRWATCPLTQNALVRVLSNPAYPSLDWMPTDVMEHLIDFLSEDLGHVFWSDGISLLDDSIFDRRFIRGHKQITDVYLLGLAVNQGGRLVTFDGSIPWKAVKGAKATHLVQPD